MSNTMWKLAVLAGLVTVGASAQALMIDDAKIMIDRALNSPTLTVKYSGAAAAMVELRLNGLSLGTREVNTKSKAGETTFTLDLSTLRDGDNDVEVRLYDKDGKVIGTEKSLITADQGARGPIFLNEPKVGATVMGSLDIKVGFGKELSNKYVSFFVNNQFRAMTNNPPFSFTWDTTREPNGWHEVEAWVVDETGSTYKTRKVKVFVNNPGGRTNRVTTPAAPQGTPANPVVAPVTAPAANAKPVTASAAAVTSTAVATPVVAPRVAVNPKVSTAPVVALKPTVSTAVAMGSRTSTPGMTTVSTGPTAKPVIDVKTGTSSTAIKAVAGAGRVSITKGTRLPDMGAFTIIMSGRPVNFDVAPRVEGGIPLTPFRHLFEGSGGQVDWDNLSKILTASKEGSDVWLKVGEKMAKVNKIDVELEIAPFIERGRTIVPLSFIKDSLKVEVEYDPATGHVLIRKAK